MKNSKAQRNKEERPPDKRRLQTTKPASERPGELFLDKRINWWLALVLVLPLIISQRAMDPIGPPRVMLLSVFLLAFLLYFFLPARQLNISRPRPLTQVLGALAASFLIMLVLTSFTGVNKQTALYCAVQY